MKFFPLMFCCGLTGLIHLQAAPDLYLAVPGEVIYEAAFDKPVGDAWKVAKGQWEIKDGVWNGAEREADQHGAVARLSQKLDGFVVEYEVRLDGAKATSLSINAPKDHMARIMISPNRVTIRRDDNDHEGPDKAVVFASFPAEIKPGTWHKVRMEMVGDTLYGQVDDLKAWGSDPLFLQPKMNPGFTVAGQSASFRNIVLRKAALNPKWEAVKADLPKPGAHAAPAPAKKKVVK